MLLGNFRLHTATACYGDVRNSYTRCVYRLGFVKSCHLGNNIVGDFWLFNELSTVGNVVGIQPVYCKNLIGETV